MRWLALRLPDICCAHVTGMPMNAYLVTATMPVYGSKKVQMIVLTAGGKRDAEAIPRKDNWVVKRVTLATADDVREVAHYSEVLRSVKAEIAAQEPDAIKTRQEDDARRAEEAERARQKLDEEAEASSRRHQVAIEVTAGDLLAPEIEKEAYGDPKIGQICAKIDLFFGHASVNRKDIYTSISLDFADLRGQRRFPGACEIIGKVIKDLDCILAIDARIHEGGQQLEAQRKSVEGQINSIASRTHIYGGSGLFLLFSALDADAAVKRDTQAMSGLERSYRYQVAKFRDAVSEAISGQHYHKFRAQIALTMLRSAPGSAVTVDLPLEVADYALRNQRNLRS